MSEPTLVELIEAYERADAACHEWIAGGYGIVEGDTPAEVLYDAQRRLYGRLFSTPGRGVRWNDGVYLVARGELVTARGLLFADEIDREGAQQ